MAKSVKPKKARANQYVMPEPLPKGEVLTDVSKQKWRIGPSIGKGGFGEIYSAQHAEKSGSSYPFVVKIEPHGNGPLFVEMHFYMKNCKPEDIAEFKSKNKLKSLGMPVFWGSGSHEFKGDKYRFIVMDKFGSDIDKLLKENNGTFAEATVFKLALQMTHVLQYIHECGYVHADLKGANILMGITPEMRDQAFLVDFGLATKFSTNKEFKPNPKRAHDGTIEYLSRDAHKGVPTRRGDFEILGYNIIHWLGGKLPWLNKLSDPNAVHSSKEEAMDKLESLLEKSFSSSEVPDGLLKFLKYVKSLKFDQEPNYKKIREIFVGAIAAAGGSATSPMKLAPKKSQLKRKSLVQEGSPEKKTTLPKKATASKKVGKKKQEPIADSEEETKTEKVAVPKRVVKKKQEPIADSEEDEEKTEKVSTRRKVVRKKQEPIADSDEEMETERVPTPKKVVKKKQEPIAASEEDEEKTEKVSIRKKVVRKKQEPIADSEEEMETERIPTPKKVVKKKQEAIADSEDEEMDTEKVSAPKRVVKKKQEPIANSEEVMTPAMLELMEKKSKNKKGSKRPVANSSKANGAVKKTNAAKKAVRNGIDSESDVEMLEVDKEKENLENDGLDIEVDKENGSNLGFDGFNDEMKEVMLKKLNNAKITKKPNKKKNQPSGPETFVSDRPRRGGPPVNYEDH